MNQTSLIKTISQLNALETRTFILALIIGAVALAIAILVSNLIPFKGGKDDSYIKRRIWFYVIGLVSAFCFWGYNQFVIMDRIKIPAFQSKFTTYNFIALIITLLVFFVLGYGIMFFFRKSKFGTILGKSKNI